MEIVNFTETFEFATMIQNSIQEYISHIRTSADGSMEIQGNDSHCRNVAILAKEFADEIGMGDFGYVMGLLHDKGKEKDEFQNYIRFQNGLTATKIYSQEGKAHAYVGGLIAKSQCRYIYPLIGNFM